MRKFRFSTGDVRKSGRNRERRRVGGGGLRSGIRRMSGNLGELKTVVVMLMFTGRGT